MFDIILLEITKFLVTHFFLYFYLNQTIIFLNLTLLDYSFSAVPVLNKDKICHAPVSNISLLLFVSIQIKYT